MADPISILTPTALFEATPATGPAAWYWWCAHAPSGPRLQCQAAQEPTAEFHHYQLPNPFVVRAQAWTAHLAAGGPWSPDSDIYQFACPTPVPEPSACLLLVVGLVGLSLLNRRRNNDHGS